MLSLVHSLAHDGDGFVSSVPLRVVQNLDHLEQRHGVGWTILLWPMLVMELSHHESLSRGTLSL